MLLKNTTICLLERVKRRTFALFFMVLDLRLVKIGCRETINFFYLYFIYTLFASCFKGNMHVNL